MGATSDPLSFARSYQLEALEIGMKQNSIVFLNTGSGKTLIAVMLLRSFASQITKPSHSIAVFLVPAVVLVSQQADVIEMHTDFKVGRFWGDMGVDLWDTCIWEQKLKQFEVFVTTPQILLNNLRHSFFKIENIKLLIFDECHHTKGKHPYACIMTEFYHIRLSSSASNTLPRIFGMTGSLINSKGSKSCYAYQKQIADLENILHSKVYTVVNETILAEHITFSNTKINLYDHSDIPDALYISLYGILENLKMKHIHDLKSSGLEASFQDNAAKSLKKLHKTFLFCLTELGLWLASKAAKTLTFEESNIHFWGNNNETGERIIRNYSKDVDSAFSKFLPAEQCIGENISADIRAGFLTTKVECLLLSLLEYRDVENLRCIVFVQRVITATVLQSLLSSLLQFSKWGCSHMSGNKSGLQTQSRKEHLSIVDSFRRGKINIIIATQILEEGLDIQSCNMVIRFDPSPTVCSFIQSRGRARMPGSDYILILERSDVNAISKVQTYLNSGDMMREQSLQLASLPCDPIKDNLLSTDFYCVATTGAIVTLNSSVQLIYFYCSRLPSDRFFKPLPRFVIDKESNTCTLQLPNSCSLSPISVKGNYHMLKQLVCLEACKKLHMCGALSDNLLPVFDVENIEDFQNNGNYMPSEEQDKYFPQELVDSWSSFSTSGLYSCYLIRFSQCFQYDISPKDIIFVVKCNLGADFSNVSFNLETDRGNLTAKIEHMNVVQLSKEEVVMARRFQSLVLNICIYHDYEKVKCALDHLCVDEQNLMIAYLLLPSVLINHNPSIDWEFVRSKIFSNGEMLDNLPHRDVDEHCCSLMKCRWIDMRDCRVRSCMIQNSVVFTPHNNYIYCIFGMFHELNGNSTLSLEGEDDSITYREFYHSRYGIDLFYTKQPLLQGRHVFRAQNYLTERFCKEKGSSTAGVELPPELCVILLSHVSSSTVYSFSLIPSVIHRIASILLASNLNILSNGPVPKNILPTMKLLEAVTTKKCKEKFSLESLETLGDSYLKYAVSLHLFKRNWHHHEGILTAKKERVVSNVALYHLGCSHKLPGFIHDEEFDPKDWILSCNSHIFSGDDKTCFSRSKYVYNIGSRFIKFKRVADVVEALIGVYLRANGEFGALQFMSWLGMDVNFNIEIPDDRTLLAKAGKYVDVKHLESLLKYHFCDPSLLVEALTHGSYQLLAIPRCYQRLEFLGDAVLDYLITVHMYEEYPNISPKLLTDLRSASVNNDCYAHAAFKAGLNKHILHMSSELHKQMTMYLNHVSNSFPCTSYGWDAGVVLPKVLGDVIESLAGAILVDSGYKKEIVWMSIKPLLEPLVSLDTLQYHPVKELNELCARKGYPIKFHKTYKEDRNCMMVVEIQIENGLIHKTCAAYNKVIAKKLAAKAALVALKEHISFNA